MNFKKVFYMNKLKEILEGLTFPFEDIDTILEDKDFQNFTIIYPYNDVLVMKGKLNGGIGIYSGIDLTDRNNKITDIDKNVLRLVREDLKLKVYHYGKISLNKDYKEEYINKEYVLEVGGELDYLEFILNEDNGEFFTSGIII